MLQIKKEGSRCSWSMEETKELLAIMKEKKLMEQLDGKTRRNNNIYVLISNELAKKGKFSMFFLMYSTDAFIKVSTRAAKR